VSVHWRVAIYAKAFLSVSVHFRPFRFIPCNTGATPRIHFRSRLLKNNWMGSDQVAFGASR
jgi:hypothetical protein